MQTPSMRHAPRYLCSTLLTILNAGSIKDVVDDARAEDVEAFGKIAMSALLGVDEAKGWLLMKGGVF